MLKEFRGFQGISRDYRGFAVLCGSHGNQGSYREIFEGFRGVSGSFKRFQRV